MSKFYCFLIVILYLACKEEASSTIIEIANPSNNSSGESSLLVDQEGQVYLSWIDLEDDTISKLQLAILTEGGFNKVSTIASGSNWFVNWADFPAITQFPNSKKLLAHWLQKSDKGTYDYDVRISSAEQTMEQWSEGKILHNDSISAEHGFVSMTPYEDKLLAVWLDGRNMTKENTGDKEVTGHSHGHGAMTLRTALIDADNTVSDRIELDHKVCECCQTDIAVSDKGPIVVYRNSEEGIRDIYYTRKIGKDWTIPKAVYDDGWEIAGCPVNGPRIDAMNNNVAISWYSGADQKVKTIYSTDSGESFSSPLIVNERETLGRLDLCFVTERDYAISYMESDSEKAKVMIKKFTVDDMISEVHEVGQTSSARASGFPRLAADKEKLYVSYTYVDSTSQRVVVKSLNI
jgi:hypothetical protein